MRVYKIPQCLERYFYVWIGIPNQHAYIYPWFHYIACSTKMPCIRKWELLGKVFTKILAVWMAVCHWIEKVSFSPHVIIHWFFMLRLYWVEGVKLKFRYLCAVVRIKSLIYITQYYTCMQILSVYSKTMCTFT